MSSSAQGEKIELRPDQHDALHAVETAEANGASRMLLDMATGLGKTEVAAQHIANKLEEDSEAKILFLCHRKGILRQARQTFERVLGDDVDHGFLMGGEQDDQRQVVYGSFQAMNGRLADGKVYQAFKPDNFKHEVIDEGHHGPAPTYRSVIEYQEPETMLSLSATTNRHDGQDLNELLGPTVYRKSLAQGLNEGLLSPMIYNMYADKLRGIDDLKEIADSLTLGQLNRTVFVPRRDDEVVRIFGEELEQVESPHGLVFCKTIEHAERMAKLLGKVLPYNVATIHSKLTEEEQDYTADAFLDGEIQLATVVSKYDEGMDVPGLNFLGFLRSTSSERIWLQQVGRGLRLADNKPAVRIADLATSLDRITMVNNLQNDISAEAEKSLALEQKEEIREIDNPVASFNFAEEAREIAELATSVRTRIDARKAKIAIEKANAKERIPRQKKEIIPESIPERFLPLSEALQKGFDLNRSEVFITSGLCSSADEYRAEVSRWRVICSRPRDKDTFRSSNKQTEDINAVIELRDKLKEHTSRHGDREFFGLYKDGTVRKLIPAEGRMHKYSPLTDEQVIYSGLSGLKVITATTDDIEKIEAVVNLGLPNGGHHSSTTIETVKYQNELAKEAGLLCERALKELYSVRSYDLEDHSEVRIENDNIAIMIRLNDVPAVNFPGADIKERYIATIEAIPRRKDHRGFYDTQQNTENYGLLEDGSLVKIEIVEDSSDETWDSTSIHSFANLPTGYYSSRTREATEQEVLPILKTIREELGAEIDWENISLDTVIESATEVFDLSPESFANGPQIKKLKEFQRESRGMTFMLIEKEKIATIEEISDRTGIGKVTIKNDIRKAKAIISKKTDRYIKSRARKDYSELIRSLPRVEI